MDNTFLVLFKAPMVFLLFASVHCAYGAQPDQASEPMKLITADEWKKKYHNNGDPWGMLPVGQISPNNQIYMPDQEVAGFAIKTDDKGEGFIVPRYPTAAWGAYSVLDAIPDDIKLKGSEEALRQAKELLSQLTDSPDSVKFPLEIDIEQTKSRLAGMITWETIKLKQLEDDIKQSAPTENITPPAGGVSDYRYTALKAVAIVASMYAIYKIAKYLNDRRIARLEMERLAEQQGQAGAGQEGAASVQQMNSVIQ